MSKTKANFKIRSFKSLGEICPVCGTADHRCGISDNPEQPMVYCYPNKGASKGEKINGYTCLSPNALHTAGFVKLEDKKKLTPEERRTYQQKQAEREARRAEEHRQELATRADFDTRDQYHQRILGELGLEPRHYELLRSKGLSESQIEKIGFRSIEQYQEFSFKLPPGIPGRHLEKKNSLTNQAGILYPIRDVIGRVVGFQNRLDDKTNGKYHTISNSKKGKSLRSKEFDELPLTFAIPSKITNNTIFITEGVAVKPDLAAEKLGGVVVGASGGLLTASAETFKRYLKVYDGLLAGQLPEGTDYATTLAIKTLERIKQALGDKSVESLGERKYCIVPDAGAFDNEQVAKTFCDNLKLLKELFGEDTIEIADWYQLTNPDAGDIDEIDISIAIRPVSFLQIYWHRLKKYLSDRVEVEDDDDDDDDDPFISYFPDPGLLTNNQILIGDINEAATDVHGCLAIPSPDLELAKSVDFIDLLRKEVAGYTDGLAGKGNWAPQVKEALGENVITDYRRYILVLKPEWNNSTETIKRLKRLAASFKNDSLHIAISNDSINLKHQTPWYQFQQKHKTKLYPSGTGYVPALNPEELAEQAEAKAETALAEASKLPEEADRALLKPFEVSNVFKRIANLAGLLPEHKQYLIRHGLNAEQINKTGYFSWNNNISQLVSRELCDTITKLIKATDSKLIKTTDTEKLKSFPAWCAKQKEFKLDLEWFKTNKNKDSYSDSFIVIPKRNAEGVILGAELYHPQTEQSMLWENKSYASVNVEYTDAEDKVFAEPALGYHQPYDGRKRPVFRKTDNYLLICSNNFKASIASHLHDVKAVSLEAWEVRSPKLLLQYLEQANRDTPYPEDFEVVVAPDARDIRDRDKVRDKVKKIHNVLAEIEKHKTHNEEQNEEQNKFNYSLLWYNQVFKPETNYQKAQKGDIHQVTRHLNRFRHNFINKNLFCTLADKHKELVKLENEFRKNKDSEAYAKRQADWNVTEINFRYLTTHFDWNNYPTGLIAIKSPMGSGKTEALRQLVEINENYKEGYFKSPRKSAILGSRNALLIQTSERIGCTHKNQLKKQGEYAFSEAISISLCVDSLLRLSPHDFFGGSLIFDEVESIINHFFLGTTCSKERAKLWHRLQAICSFIVQSRGRIVLLDANLSAFTLKFFEQLVAVTDDSGIKCPFDFHLIHNKYQTEEHSWDVQLFAGGFHESEYIKDGKTYIKRTYQKNNRLPQLDKMIQQLDAGKNIFIACDTKKEVLAITQLLNAHLQDKEQAGIAITAETMTSDAKAFMKSPDGWLEKNKQWCRFVASSPTIESGVSIDGDFFDAVFGIFFGNTSTTETQIQMLGRVRRNVPRFIFCKEIAVGVRSLYNDERPILEQLYTPKKVRSERLKEVASAVIILDLENHLLKLDSPELQQHAMKLLDSQNWHTPFLRIWAELDAAKNWNKSNLRRDLIYFLRKKGHRVTISDTETSTAPLLNQYKEAKEITIQAKAKATAGAAIIKIDTAVSLLENNEANDPETLNSIRRALLQDELPGIEIKAPLVRKCLLDKNGVYLNNLKKLAKIRNTKYVYNISQNNYIFDAIDANNPELRVADLPTEIIDLLSYRNLGLKELVDPEKIWDSEKLIRMLEAARYDPDREPAKDKSSCCQQLRLFPGKKGDPLELDAAIDWANKLLSYVGMNLEEVEGKWKLDTKDNFDNKEFCDHLWAVEAHLEKRSAEALEKRQKEFDFHNRRYQYITLKAEEEEQWRMQSQS